MSGVPARPEAAAGLTINGRTVEMPDDGGQSLGLFLREQLGLRGTKIGCGNGECGACTVLVGDRAVCSCLYPAGRAAGQKVTTIEGLDDDAMAERIRSALIESGAFQCGFCTPGVVMSLVALFRRERHPSEAGIRTALQGNVCRCSGYIKLLEAVRGLALAPSP